MEKTEFTVWFQCTLGACRLYEEDLSKSGPDVNSLALATATITRVRNANASAVHYRMPTMMFHSGVKHDLIRLNRLGVLCPQMRLKCVRTSFAPLVLDHGRLACTKLNR